MNHERSKRGLGLVSLGNVMLTPWTLQKAFLDALARAEAREQARKERIRIATEIEASDEMEYQ